MEDISTVIETLSEFIHQILNTSTESIDLSIHHAIDISTTVNQYITSKYHKCKILTLIILFTFVIKWN